MSLAVDAGGTSTRAVLVEAEGRCRGYGRAAGGNPTARGARNAADSVAAAAAQALAAPGVDPAAVEVVLVAHAGGGSAEYYGGVRERLAGLGVRASLSTAGDLTAVFASGTHELDGAALIAGTGAIGGAIRGGGLHRIVGGAGWLLGDDGSGFWIGHRIARAVVDDLDGGPTTGLTADLLARFELGDGGDRTPVRGRPAALGSLVSRLYELQPVELSRLAPLAFALADRDEVARTIVRDAVVALAALLQRVRCAQSAGPLVFGGSVLVDGVLRLGDDLRAPLLDAASGGAPIPVADGSVGAAVLAFRAGGVEVDAPLFARLSGEIRAAAASWIP